MTRGRRIMAARYLRTLSAVEAMAFHGNYSEVRRLLNAIDPEEAKNLAREIERDDVPQIPQLRLLDAPLDMRIADGVARALTRPARW